MTLSVASIALMMQREKPYFCGHLEVNPSPIARHAELSFKSEVAQGLIQASWLQDIHHCCCYRVRRSICSLYNLHKLWDISSRNLHQILGSLRAFCSLCTIVIVVRGMDDNWGAAPNKLPVANHLCREIATWSSLYEKRAARAPLNSPLNVKREEGPHCAIAVEELRHLGKLVKQVSCPLAVPDEHHTSAEGCTQEAYLKSIKSTHEVISLYAHDLKA